MDHLKVILRHLRSLVAINTCNPPRNISGSGPLVESIREALPGFSINVTDLGDGSVIIEADRGRSDILFNVHLDTVPVAHGWTVSPHQTHERSDRVLGLGTCDIKGAAAILFALAETTDLPMKLVLTTDEEAGQSVCIRHYLADACDTKFAIVAEPTGSTPVLRHRGIVSAKTKFHGKSGHASGQGTRSALHEAAIWISGCLANPAAASNRLNFGKISGGVKPNMTAAETEVIYGFRPQPGVDHGQLLQSFLDVSERPLEGATTIRFVGPALPADEDGVASRSQASAREFLARVQLEPGPPVDFFTEASFFAASGVPVAVLGPGHITEAHAVDEWVSYDQLSQTFHTYHKLLTRSVGE